MQCMKLTLVAALIEFIVKARVTSGTAGYRAPPKSLITWRNWPIRYEILLKSHSQTEIENETTRHSCIWLVNSFTSVQWISLPFEYSTIAWNIPWPLLALYYTTETIQVDSSCWGEPIWIVSVVHRAIEEATERFTQSWNFRMLLSRSLWCCNHRYYKYKNILKKWRGCRVRCGIEDIKSTETRYM